MATLRDISQAIAKCKAAYPNWSPDPDMTPEVWLEDLGDLASETLAAAVMACRVQPGRAFAPSTGEIRGAALELNARAAGIPDAYRAYEEVTQMPHSMERTEVTDEYTDAGAVVVNVRVLKFSHPVVESVARMIGWPQSVPTDMPGVDRSQFTKAYDAEVARYMADAGRPAALTEYIESKRAQLSGGAPMLAGNAMRKLTAEKATR